MTGIRITNRIAAMFLAMVLLSVFILPTQVARAATIEVKDTCTLADAIIAADTDTAAGDCPAGSGADIIVLADGATYTLTGGTLPAIHSQITIEGNGSIIERSSAIGTPEFRIFYISASGDLTLNEVTVSNGRNAPGGGGGIKNWGVLTLNHSAVMGNTGRGIITLEGSSLNIYNSNISNNSGGGISNNRGSVVIDNSTISGNYDIDRGAGISNYLGSVAVYNSTINGNSTTYGGGGIYNRSGVLTIINSTIRDNLADVDGGGIYNIYNGVVELTNITISGNSAGGNGGGIITRYESIVDLTSSTVSGNSVGGVGGGIWVGTGNVELTNTLMGFQLSGLNCARNAVTSRGYNLDSDGSCNLSAPGDLSGFDPLLGPLSDNGGPTWTHALLSDSPAIDAVPFTSCTVPTDQRGVSRPQGFACDIGAFEIEYSGPVYTITDLGVYEGRFCGASGINDLGHVVGSCEVSDYNEHPILWEDGEMIDLGTLGGESDEENLNEATGINNNDQIVGYSLTPNLESHAFLWEKGVMTDLGTLGGRGSTASAINDRGQVVGISQNTAGEWHAFLWEKGTMLDLGTLGGNQSHALGINERGQIVGLSKTAEGDRHAFLWERGTMTDLGTLGGNYSIASGINNLGQIVGLARLADGANHAFLWENGTMVDLGPVGGETSNALAINVQGQMVGYSQQNQDHATLWENGAIIDLGALPVGDFSVARAINRAGLIAGSCLAEDGQYHACMWKIDR